MAKPDLFKDLPKPTKPRAPREDPEEPTDVEQDPNEFPLGEYEKDPVIIEELPPDPAPPDMGTTPPPEESLPEVEVDPEPEVEPEVPSEDDEDPDLENPDPDEEVSASAAAGRMTEIEMLKNRARLMGIAFSNNIGLDSLKSKITARMEGEKGKEAAGNLRAGKSALNDDDGIDEAEEVLPVKTDRQQMYETEMRLVRLRITNLDPKKKDLPGEIFTVANKMLGAVKKFIPYGEATDNGYHVPYVIYRQLKEREFLNIKTRKDRQGRTIVETGMAREFALEELPPLTQKELLQLAASQAAAAGMSS